jgi:hypothetical protein
MAYPKTVLVGDRVRYESAAGTIRGEVVAIVDRMCADDVVRPWIGVQHYLNGRETVTYLSDAALEMMKFVVTFRDIDIQIARGEKVAA